MRKEIFLVLCVMVFAAVSTCKGFAGTFTLDVIPEDNSGALNLTSQGQIRYGEEQNFTVKIRVTSDHEKYEIKQRMIEPLQNEKGTVLNSSAVVFYSLRGSNAGGSLFAEDITELNGMETILYSSSEQGDDDQFTIVYSVLGREINASGKFKGQIRYFLIPRGGEGIEQEEILNVYLDAEKNNFSVEVITSSQNEKKLKLSVENEEIKGYVKMNFNGVLGEKYDLYQIVKQDFKNDAGVSIPPDVIRFSLFAKKGQLNYSSLSSSSWGKSLLIYSSDSQTETDEVVIGFSVDQDKIREMPDGWYRAELEYEIRVENEIKKIIPIEVEFEIKPVFEIEVIFEEGRKGLYFRDLKPSDSFEDIYKRQEVIIKVKSNLKKPYNVIQRLKEPLTNSKGDTIPLEFFTLQQEIDKSESGEIVFSRDSSLKLEDMNVFISDVRGSPSKFKVIYSLRINSNLKAGDYFTDLSYSLVEK